MAVIPAEELRVPEADHVIGKNDRAHAGKRRTTMLLIGTLAGALGAAVMSVGTEHRWKGTLPTEGAVEGSVDEEAGNRLKTRRLGRIAVELDLLTIDRIERRLLRQRIETGPGQDLPANLQLPGFPLIEV